MSWLPGGDMVVGERRHVCRFLRGMLHGVMVVAERRLLKSSVHKLLAGNVVVDQPRDIVCQLY